MIELRQGQGPLVLGLPHTGTDLPVDIRRRLNATGRALADTDWHVHRLYEGLAEDVTIVRTPIHRYAIDVNRPPGGESLYPGQATTGLVPLTDFDGAPIWNEPPDAAETARRLDLFHRPYHAALTAELARVRDLHGVAILYDCHSIRSVIPNLFAGTLPDFNIGTNLSTSCAPAVENAVRRVCEAAPGFSTVVNGRFRGGWTTRHHGRPAEGVHAIQMELAQSTYMRESPPWAWAWDAARAESLRPHLARVLAALDRLGRQGIPA